MYESYYVGVTGPGFLNQVPTLPLAASIMCAPEVLKEALFRLATRFAVQLQVL